MHRASSIVGEVKGKGQEKGQIHLISYTFASNCHRDFKLGLYFSYERCIKYDLDLDLEKFGQGQKFGNIN